MWLRGFRKLSPKSLFFLAPGHCPSPCPHPRSFRLSTFLARFPSLRRGDARTWQVAAGGALAGPGAKSPGRRFYPGATARGPGGWSLPRTRSRPLLSINRVTGEAGAQSTRRHREPRDTEPPQVALLARDRQTMGFL